MAGRISCHGCSVEVEIEDPIGRSARCARCGSELRCCLNCRFYDTSSYNDCVEPSAERVLEKDRANFCDYFSPRPAAAASGPRPESPDRLSDLEKLFRK
jgi:hypothetical protein